MRALFAEPLVFRPLYQERVWGGRRLESVFGRQLPPGRPIGESWELVDRPEAQSVVDGGPLAGATLHDLWTRHRDAVFGPHAPDAARFPLLAKILDARETLSVQVHPPARVAERLGAEPKTEMWYVLEAEEDAAVYAGFRAGVTRGAFERALGDGSVEGLLHRIPVAAGDAITIPSGRCHAIGAGCLIAEIQQNSDSTYRVYDWNRVGLDGRPRELHLCESMESIDFNDSEPALTPPGSSPVSATPWFRVHLLSLGAGATRSMENAGFVLVLDGSAACGGRVFRRGEGFWLPAESERSLVSGEGARLLCAGFGGD